jgi:hypothetical protein
MSKKNSRVKPKQYHEFLAKEEKEFIRRSQIKKERKLLKHETKSITNCLDNFGVQETSNIIQNKETIKNNSGMEVERYRRPKKATRIKRRHREAAK